MSKKLLKKCPDLILTLLTINEFQNKPQRSTFDCITECIHVCYKIIDSDTKFLSTKRRPTLGNPSQLAIDLEIKGTFSLAVTDWQLFYNVFL